MAPRRIIDNINEEVNKEIKNDKSDDEYNKSQDFDIVSYLTNLEKRIISLESALYRIKGAI